MVETVGGRLRGCGGAVHHAMLTINCNTSNTWVFDPFNALDLSGWHHSRVADPLGNLGWQEENVYVGRGEHGIGPPSHGDTDQRGPGHSGPDAAPDFVNHNRLLP